ncbi:hypothetical protein EYF80_003314 [Liparis tanakae]|uniref:Uncharacterized protein n=1 Tax=Liparis tanakae TaxID=230148 RepID=A0A4Z2J9S7_9TELE|nr:hypothetical protein EYF80_003314 [Liparis tanakae]
MANRMQLLYIDECTGRVNTDGSINGVVQHFFFQVTAGCGKPRAVQRRVIFSPTLAVTSTGASENNGPAVEGRREISVMWNTQVVVSPPTSRLTVPAEVPAELLATQLY